MGKITDMKNEIAMIQAKMRRLVAELAVYILELPDNTAIKRISGNIYIMNSSDLKNNWSAYYYDFKFQYRLISVAITEAKDPLVTLDNVLLNGKVKVAADPYTYSLNPEVIAKVSELKQQYI